MPLIPLSQGQYALVGSKDFAHLMQFRWHARWSRHTQSFYAWRTSKNPLTGRYIGVSMASEIKGPVPIGYKFWDHKNGVSLDNRRGNLRPITVSQNMINSRGSGRNTSGFRGVNFLKSKGKWRAQITFKGKVFFLGYFDNPKDGSVAYKKAAKKLHGKYSRVA